MFKFLKNWWQFGLYGLGVRKAWRIHRMIQRDQKLQKTCKHEGYTFKQHGRCCPHCGMLLVDFGD